MVEKESEVGIRDLDLEEDPFFFDLTLRLDDESEEEEEVREEGEA